MADLGQKLGLGIDLGVAGGEVATQAELIFGDAPRSFTQRDAHQQAAKTHHRHQGQHQLLRCDQRQPQQGGQDQQGADVENDHGHDKQTSRAVTLLQVVTGHQQNAQAGQGDQHVGGQVQRQAVEEQQQQATQAYDQDVDQQQFMQGVRPTAGEKAVGKHQPARRGEDQCQIGAGGLPAVPLREPRAEQV